MVSLTDAPTQTQAGTRQHGLDALRAGALLLGIALHSFLPFLPGIPWLVSDSQSSWVLFIPVYVIHLFRMALFMLLAGYFGRLVLQRRGAGRYFRDRVLRILLPSVVFWPVAVLSLGLLAVANAKLRGGPPIRPAPPAGNPLLSINPGQLWFLLMIFSCVVIVLVIRMSAVRALGSRRCVRIAAGTGWLLAAPGGVLIATLPYFFGLLQQGTVVGGIIAPTTILPSAPALTAYLGAFVVGWALHASHDGLARIARFWLAYLAVAVLLSGVGLQLSAPDSTAPLPFAAGVMSLAGWCWVYALLGLTHRWLTRDRPLVRYLADASYWMYLIHLPLLVGFEILLVPLGWPIAVKLALTWTVCGVVLLVSYHLLVRSTLIGRWLNGRRYPFRLR